MIDPQLCLSLIAIGVAFVIGYIGGCASERAAWVRFSERMRDRHRTKASLEVSNRAVEAYALPPWRHLTEGENWE